MKKQAWELEERPRRQQSHAQNWEERGWEGESIQTNRDNRSQDKENGTKDERLVHGSNSHFEVGVPVFRVKL